MASEIAALRRQVRILSALVFSFAIVAGFAGWQAATTAKLQRLDLIDAAGKQVGVLRNDGGGSLVFIDAAGRRAAIGFIGGQSTIQARSLQIIDDKGEVTATLETTGKGAALTLLGEGKSSAAITTETGSPSLLIADRSSKTLLDANTVGIIDGKGKVTMGIADGEGIVVTTDKTGRLNWSSPSK